MGLDATGILYLFFTLFTCVIAIPYCLYAIYHFYEFNDDARFKKRHGRLSTITALCFVGELFSGSLLTLAFSGLGDDQFSIILAWIGDILNFIFYFLVIHCLVLRFWCLYYDIKYQLSTTDNVWKSIIDEHYVINEEHLSTVKSFDIDDDLWFIKNKSKEGNSKWMAKRWFFGSFVFILAILLGLIAFDASVSIKVIRRGVIEVIFTVLLLVPWAGMIWIYHKIPQFLDTFSIRREIVIVHNLDLIDVIASAAVSIVANYVVIKFSNANTNSFTSTGNPYDAVIGDPWLNATMITTFYIMGITHVIIIYIMTSWARARIMEDQQHIAKLSKRTSSHDAKFLRFSAILENPVGFELFMEHLVDEFSIENMLSLIEWLQYKARIKQMFDFSVCKDDQIPFSLPMKHIPKSTIVYGPRTGKRSTITMQSQSRSVEIVRMDGADGNDGGDDAKETAASGHGSTDKPQHEANNSSLEAQVPDEEDSKKVRKMIYQLWDKYIRAGGDLEVNLSYEVRSGFDKFIDQNKQTLHENVLLSEKEYYKLFDECIMEVIGLMNRDSYVRFLLTERYQKLKENEHFAE